MTGKPHKQIPSTSPGPELSREAMAAIAMHGELASQGDGIDWSDRPSELAALSVAYADALILACGETAPDAPKG